jgi:predicted secreted protein
MAVSTAIAIYFLIWWIVLFAILPFGVRPQGEEAPPGTDPGAPAVPCLMAKLLWTTIVATVVFGLCVLNYINGWITLDLLARWMGVSQQ